MALFGGARRRTGELDLLGRERIALVGLAVGLVALGILPRPILQSLEETLAVLRPAAVSSTTTQVVEM